MDGNRSALGAGPPEGWLLLIRACLGCAPLGSASTQPAWDLRKDSVQVLDKLCKCFTILILGGL
jgi:hypothetical protein